MNSKFTLAICGTTERTVQCAEALRTAHLQEENVKFEIGWVVTPPPKPVGRKKTLTPSPLEDWAREHNIPVLHVEKKLSEIQSDILTHHQARPIDYLLVVDFGYLVPPWLLELPKIAPINVHPSDLPKWRGSSPAQFSLLYGDEKTAVCIMRLVWELDAGPVIRRLPFTVSPTMTQESYYKTAFELASAELASTLIEYAANRNETSQPEQSPTPIAARFTREDGFVPFSFFLEAIGSQNSSSIPSQAFSALMESIRVDQKLPSAQFLDRMVRALSPWPGVWTTVPEHKGKNNIRLKILNGMLLGNIYQVTAWQFEGQSPQTGTLSL